MKKGILAGGFDILHPGYIAAFREAKEYCDKLIVCVQNDPSEERSDKIRPVLPLIDRVEILRSIKYIDMVLFYFTENDLLNMLKTIKPDIRFLGEDYKIYGKHITGIELNIPIRFLSRTHGWSETKLKEMICKSMEAR